MRKEEFKSWLGLGITLLGSIGMGLALLLADILYPHQSDSVKAGFYIVCVIAGLMWFSGLMLCVRYKNNATTIKAEGIIALVSFILGIILFTLGCLEKTPAFSHRLVLGGGYSLFLGFGLGVPFIISRSKTWYVYWNIRVLKTCFPLQYKKDMKKIIRVLSHDKMFAKLPIYTYGTFSLNPRDKITLPYRIYMAEIKERQWNKLNENQKLLLGCLYTRSCDGYLREKYTSYIMRRSENITFPFIIYNGGDYVKEIVEKIYETLKDKDNTNIRYYGAYNRYFLKVNYDRMISYWNYYERNQTPRYQDYVGYKLFTECFGLTRSLYKRS